jgi:hypothetical protein
MGTYLASFFRDSRAAYEALERSMASEELAHLDHAALEEHLESSGRELMRLLLQDHLSLRFAREEGQSQETGCVTGSDGEARSERRHSKRSLGSLFGAVVVRRLAWVRHGVAGGLRPLDAELNLPTGLYSFGVRREVAWSAAQTSFEGTVSQLHRGTGSAIAKRQVEELAVAAAVDFDAFYWERPSTLEDLDDHLVLTFDGKGVVMRPEGLRPETRKRAAKAARESSEVPSERPNRKRMAEVAAVYSLPVKPRVAEDVMRELRGKGPRVVRPRPRNKRVWASLEQDTRAVVDAAFYEALGRDEHLVRDWVVLVDGNQEQLRAVKASARNYGVQVTIVVDFIHVLEYLWAAGRALLGDDPELAQWVQLRARRLLEGQASQVAAGIRRSGTAKRLKGKAREKVDACADYLLNHKAYLRYHEYLRAGFPIATGVIEGACRSLVRDRMDITGARWGLPGAEAILKLRSLRQSGDFDDYWAFHMDRERERNHLSRYDDGELGHLRKAA